MMRLSFFVSWIDLVQIFVSLVVVSNVIFLYRMTVLFIKLRGRRSIALIRAISSSGMRGFVR